MELIDKEALIKKYAQNKLTNEELETFEALMINDAEFLSLQKQYENVQKAITANEKDEIKARLKSLDTIDKPISLKKWLIAVIVIVSLSLAGNYWYQNSQNSKTLYSNYFQPYPNALQPVTRDDVEINTLTQAVLAYENEDYDTALSKFNILLELEENDDITFYKAMSLLNIGNTEEANKLLITIENGSTQFLPQVYWYSALVYIKGNDVENATKKLLLLEAIHTTYKKEETKLLLKRLKP